MIKILVVEDEPNVGDVIVLYLKRAGFQVELVNDGCKAVEISETIKPDLIILDIMLPCMDGWNVIKQIRENKDTPIIVLTARQEENDRIAGLELGADDYVVKPFSPQELVSRVRAVLRRTSKDAENTRPEVVQFDSLIIDPITRIVTNNTNVVDLTAKEFEILYHLVRHPRQVFTRDQLLNQIWGESEYIDADTVTVHIHRLREKLESDPTDPKRLITVWGVGYKFEP